MPNLPERYQWSMRNEREAAGAATYEDYPHEPCLGGCGVIVGQGMKCPECATQAVIDWLERRKR